VKLVDTASGPPSNQAIGDIAGSYTIAFVAGCGPLRRPFPQLKVEVNAPNSEDLRVRARSRYYASLRTGDSAGLAARGHSAGAPPSQTCHRAPASIANWAPRAHG